jgi:hypothetical protein
MLLSTGLDFGFRAFQNDFGFESAFVNISLFHFCKAEAFLILITRFQVDFAS